MEGGSFSSTQRLRGSGVIAGLPVWGVFLQEVRSRGSMFDVERSMFGIG